MRCKCNSYTFDVMKHGGAWLKKRNYFVLQ